MTIRSVSGTAGIASNRNASAVDLLNLSQTPSHHLSANMQLTTADIPKTSTQPTNNF